MDKWPWGGDPGARRAQNQRQTDVISGSSASLSSIHAALECALFRLHVLTSGPRSYLLKCGRDRLRKPKGIRLPLTFC